MADYYQQFAQTIGGITPKEKEWITSYLAHIDTETEKNPDALDAWIKERPIYKNIDEELEMWPHFEWLLEGKEWTLYSEDSANMDVVGFILKEFLKKFRPTDIIGIEWGYTCSKLRSDGFGGGAMVITSSRIKYLSTMDWIYSQFQQIENRRKKNEKVHPASR